MEARLERDAEGIPRVRVAREAVEKHERRASFAAPVEDVELQAVDDDIAVDRTEEIDGGPHDSRPGHRRPHRRRIIGRPPSLDARRPPEHYLAPWRSAATFRRKGPWPRARPCSASRAKPRSATSPRSGSATTSSFRGKPPATIPADASRTRRTSPTSRPSSP